MSTRRDHNALRLTVAGGLLVGFGLAAELPTEGPPGTTAVDDGAAGRVISTAGGSGAPRHVHMMPAVSAVQDGRAGFVARASALPDESGSAVGLSDRIVIPALGVSAPVVPISAGGGTLIPPSSPSVVGWWSGGARPGAATGTAVLTGHTVSSGGGVFDDLDLMSTGQRVRIDMDGRSVSYLVNSVTIYRKASLAEHAAAIFDQSVNGRVALVTCEDWNGSVYLSNAVVIAEPTF